MAINLLLPHLILKGDRVTEFSLWIPGREDHSEKSAGSGPEREIVKTTITVIVKERKGKKREAY